MNKWHRLHAVYKDIHEESERLKFAIQGDVESRLSFEYDDVGKRFGKYAPWLSSPEVYAVKFEDLIGSDREKYIREMVRHHWSVTGEAYDLDDYTQRAIDNVDPSRSHTFRSGKSGKWKQSFDEPTKVLFKQYAGQMLIDLGYEENLDW